MTGIYSLTPTPDLIRPLDTFSKGEGKKREGQQKSPAFLRGFCIVVIDDSLFFYHDV
ncbi:MAG: hypothetical protein NTX03_05830 [Bacteroidetes bacterium]|nr:hypothetical protein [Bacteroidota bacterium]